MAATFADTEAGAPRDLSDRAALVRAADIHAEAAATGESVAAAALRRCRAIMEGPTRSVSSGVWRQMAPLLRQVLVTMATDRRDAEAAALQPWAAFTDAERAAIGAAAREWRRQLEGAAWMR